MEEKKISVHEKPRGENVYVYVNEYKGTTYLHIREWYLDADKEEKPTKKGVTLPLDKVDALRKALDEVMAEAQAGK